jgi:hypothetical protein
MLQVLLFVFNLWLIYILKIVSRLHHANEYKAFITLEDRVFIAEVLYQVHMTSKVFYPSFHDDKDVDRNRLVSWQRDFISLDLDTLPKLFNAFADQILCLKDTL